VLQHGFGDTYATWNEYGYVDALKPYYRTVLIDSRGHGESDKPHEASAYGTNLASDVVAVLNDLGIDRAHFYGYALGGWVGLVLAKLWPHRFASIVIGGSSPVEGTMPDEAVRKLTAVLKSGAAAFTEGWEAQAPISPSLRRRLLMNDMDALGALWDNLVENPVNLEDALPTFPSPYLLIFGEKDPLYPVNDVLKYSSRLSEGSVIILPELNHLEAFQRSEVVLPYLASFLERASAHTYGDPDGRLGRGTS
jgi:pimeloyl-ACP methyl ester carboxylesterase